MKRFLVFCLILFCSTLLIKNVSGQTFSNAVEYMQYMTNEYDIISKDTWDYIKAASRGKSAKKVDDKRQELINSVATAKRKIARMPDFEGDVTYRDTVVSYLELTHAILSEDFGKIVDMEAIAEESYDAMEAYLMAKEKANDKMDVASEMLIEEQKIFAEKNNITLVNSEDKLSKKLKQSGEVISYYNVIYLIFFKSYKQEVYLLDAMNANDVNAIEQNRESLISTTKEGLSKLDTLKSFKSDPNLKFYCQKMLKFYLDEAENKIPNITNFYLEKEKFEKMQKAFEAIKEKDRTQEDIDNYNGAIDSYNKAVNLSNSTNEQLNTNRSAKHKDYNKAVKSFMDKHMP